MIVRPERPGDEAGVRDVHVPAFPTAAESLLVDRLRETGNARISLVAEEAGEIVGHVVFSPVVITGDETAHGLGLAPVAVLPARQGGGIGGALILAGLEQCRAEDVPFVVLLGHPSYYPRFGFERADSRHVQNEYGATDAFMVLELSPGGLPPGGGLARYGPEFAEFGE